MYFKIYVCIYIFSTLYLIHNEYDGIISSLKLSVRTGLRKDIPNEKVKKPILDLCETGVILPPSAPLMNDKAKPDI